MKEIFEFLIKLVYVIVLSLVLGFTWMTAVMFEITNKAVKKMGFIFNKTTNEESKV